MFYKLKYLIVVMLTFFVSNFTVYAADTSTITIKGEVKDNTCTIAPGSQEQEVSLLTHAAKQLYAINQVTSMVPFFIELAPCGTSVVSVKVKFAGTGDLNNSSLLAIETDSSTASGVGIQILDSNKSPLMLNAASSNIAWIPLEPGVSNTLHFYARLMATKLPVTAGLIRATATFTLEFQ